MGMALHVIYGIRRPSIRYSDKYYIEEIKTDKQYKKLVKQSKEFNIEFSAYDLYPEIFIAFARFPIGSLFEKVRVLKKLETFFTVQYVIVRYFIIIEYYCYEKFPTVGS